MCAFHWGSYTSFLIRQCLNTVSVKLKKWYFTALWRLWRKVKYPEIKHRKKCSKKLISDVYIHFRDLKLTLRCQFGNSVFEESGNWYLVVPGGLWWERKSLPMKIGEKLSEQLLSDVSIHLIKLNRSLDWAVWNHCFCGTWERTFGITLKNMLKKKYPSIKTRRKLSVKLL